MRKKLRSDRLSARLTSAQCALVIEKLKTERLVDVVKFVKEAFGVQASVGSLSRLGNEFYLGSLQTDIGSEILEIQRDLAAVLERVNRLSSQIGVSPLELKGSKTPVVKKKA